VSERWVTHFTGDIGNTILTNTLSMEQARVIVTTSSRTADRNQMDALLEIALAYSQLDPRRGIEIVDTFVDPFNDLAAAAAILRTVQRRVTASGGSSGRLHRNRGKCHPWPNE
jgi:hypothetical protein